MPAKMKNVIHNMKQFCSWIILCVGVLLLLMLMFWNSLTLQILGLQFPQGGCNTFHALAFCHSLLIPWASGTLVSFLYSKVFLSFQLAPFERIKIDPFLVPFHNRTPLEHVYSNFFFSNKIFECITVFFLCNHRVFPPLCVTSVLVLESWGMYIKVSS